MNKKRQRHETKDDNGFEQWGGYMAAKKNKLQEQFKEQADKEGHTRENKIFQNVSIFVNGYTVPSADDLKRIMMVHGGTFHHYYHSEHTTHIIASNLPDVKIKQLKSLHVRVVKPEWIRACLDAGYQVDFRPYLLYSHQSTTQPSIFQFSSLKGNSSAYPQLTSSTSTNQKCNTDAEQSSTSITDEGGLLESEDKPKISSDYFCEGTPIKLNSVKGISNGDVVTLESSTSLLDKEIAQQQPSVSTSKPSGSKSRCATESNFISDFYNNSRLHHISTMGAMFKQHINELRLKSNSTFPGRTRLKDWKKQNPVIPLSKVGFCCDEDLTESNVQSSSEALSISSDRVIMHVDMDCFFVSVGLKKFPHLKGKPVAVTHSKGVGAQNPQNREGADRKYELNFYKQRFTEKLRQKISGSSTGALKDDSEVTDPRLEWVEGISDSDSLAEIASCSYEARNKGVKNGMFMGSALKLCPDLEVIPYDFDSYKEAAFVLYNTVASYTLDIEAVSCDEMFVDCSKLLMETGCSPLEFGACLREEIKEKAQCAASTGFGCNRLLSRLATRVAKPDGMFHLQSASVTDFMNTVKVNDLPGVGYAMAARLKAMGVLTCGDLQKLSLKKLCELGSKTGQALYEHCRGRDDQPLNFGHQRKSVSAEINYGIRFKTSLEAEVFIRQLAGEVQDRLAEVQMKGRCITLKLMVRAEDAPAETAKYMGHGVCDNITRSSTLSHSVGDSTTISREVISILKKLNVNPSDLRGIGIQVSRLESLSSYNSCLGALDKFFVKKAGSHLAKTSDQGPSRNKNDFKEDGNHTIVAFDLPSINTPCEVSTKEINDAPKVSIENANGVKGIDQFMVARKKSTRKDIPFKLPAPAELDLAVFSALPEEIRNEILQEYSLIKNPESFKNPDILHPKKVDKQNVDNTRQPASNTSGNSFIVDVSSSQVDPTFLEALPQEMRSEIEENLNQRRNLKGKSTKIAPYGAGEKVLAKSKTLVKEVCCKEKSILSSVLSTREVRDMIQEWVSHEIRPLACDVHILKHYFKDLVMEKNIDDLYIIIKGFHRCVSKRAEMIWVEEYRSIILSVQCNMQEVYQSRLQVEEDVFIPASDKDS